MEPNDPRTHTHLSKAGKQPHRACLFSTAEFFAGIGLVRLALEKQNWKVLWANDIDPDKAEMYHANFGKSDLVIGDIHKIPAADIPDCTLYTASFPCNDLSIADATDPQRCSLGSPKPRFRLFIVGKRDTGEEHSSQARRNHRCPCYWATDGGQMPALRNADILSAGRLISQRRHPRP